MVKRIYLLALAIVLGTGLMTVKAQYYYLDNKYYGSDAVVEVGGSVGLMNSLTDLGGKKGIGKGFIKDLTFKTTKPSFSLYGLIMYKDALALRLEGTFGTVQGYDSILKKSAASTFGRYERNLSFKSKIMDFQLAFEVHPLFFKLYEEDEAPFISPYLVAGIGYYSFNPQAEINGTTYNLQPLRTEGQGFKEYPDRKPYKLNQFNVPVGLGVKYELSPTMNVRLEAVHRFLFTDYLDDVSTTYIDPSTFYTNLPGNQALIASQLANRTINGPSKAGEIRGNPDNNDSFFTIQLKFGMTIRTSKREQP